MNIQKILLSVVMVGSLTSMASASAQDRARAFLRGNDDAAAITILTEAGKAHLLSRPTQEDLDLINATIRLPEGNIATAVARVNAIFSDAIPAGSLYERTRVLVEREAAMQERLATAARQMDICRGLVQVLGQQIHREDPTYGPTINFDDPRALEELLEKVKGMRIRAQQPAATCDGDFEVVSRSDLRH